MRKVSDAYIRNGSFKDIKNVDCEVRSEYAKRAICLFPTDGDCNAVLDNTSIDTSDHLNPDITFE